MRISNFITVLAVEGHAAQLAHDTRIYRVLPI
jgi:hypothetical protein